MTKRTDNVNSQDSAYLSPADLERRWNVSKSLVYKIIHSEGFPAPLRLGTTGANGKSLRFNRVQIEEWERKNTQHRSTR
jgi:predicted DNA-binding transcriptional regulator AlpA